MADDAPTKDVLFDGNPADLDRLLAHVSVRFLSDPAEFETDSQKSAFLGTRFRGPALDWLANILSTKPAELNNFTNFTNLVKNAFGVDSERRQVIAQGQLMALKQDGVDLLQFLAEFEALCTKSGNDDDDARLLLAPSKLDSYYRDAMTTSTTAHTSWVSYKQALGNLYAKKASRAGGLATERKRKRAKCGKCGKRGHTAMECRSGN